MPLAPKTCRREVSKTHKKQHQKSKKTCQKCAPKRYTEKLSFCGFSEPGAKGVPGWSQRPTRAPSKVKFDRKLYKKGCVRGIISVMFYLDLSQTEPTCPQVLLRCFLIFPDSSRVLICVICKEPPTETPPRKNKQKQINNIHFQFHGILTVLVRRPCAPSKHRLD